MKWNTCLDALGIIQWNQRRDLHQRHAVRRAKRVLLLITLVGLLLATGDGRLVGMSLGAIGSQMSVVDGWEQRDWGGRAHILEAVLEGDLLKDLWAKSALV